jgi:hypothetical protein
MRMNTNLLVLLSHHLLHSREKTETILSKSPKRERINYAVVQNRSEKKDFEKPKASEKNNSFWRGFRV